LEAAQHAHPTQPMGTAEFMAPEQWTAGRVDARTDLWALGVLAYHLVTGRAPFQAASLHDLHSLICAGDQPPPPVALLSSPAPAAPRPFFARPRARSPADRLGSAEELARAFSVACGVV